MARQIYVNLPVKKLDRTMDFFKALNFGFNPQFTNDDAACLVLDENIMVMLLTEAHFRKFTNKAICDTAKSTEVLLALTCANRAEVDELVALAVAAGGKIAREPEDYGFMYSHAFEDLDGHTWEPFYMESTE